MSPSEVWHGGEKIESLRCGFNESLSDACIIQGEVICKLDEIDECLRMFFHHAAHFCLRCFMRISTSSWMRSQSCPVMGVGGPLSSPSKSNASNFSCRAFPFWFSRKRARTYSLTVL